MVGQINCCDIYVILTSTAFPQGLELSLFCPIVVSFEHHIVQFFCLLQGTEIMLRVNIVNICMQGKSTLSKNMCGKEHKLRTRLLFTSLTEKILLVTALPYSLYHKKSHLLNAIFQVVFYSLSLKNNARCLLIQFKNHNFIYLILASRITFSIKTSHWFLNTITQW